MKLLRDPRVILAAAVVVGAVLVVVALFVVPRAGGGERCEFEWEGNTYPCEVVPWYAQSGTAQTVQEEQPWWANDVAQAVYAFIGFGIPAAGGAWAYWRHRQRRERLESYMRRLEDTMAAHKANPSDGARAMVALRQQVRADFRAGRVDDGHFLELDKRATTHILKLRLLELDHRFPALPMSLRHQVSTLIGDGTVSAAEVNLVRNSLSTQLIPGRVRDDLLALLDAWSQQDAAGAPADAAAGTLPDGPDDAPVLVQLKEG